MHNEILTTLMVFLSSANREIVKSVLGFVKLAIHTLPVDLVRPHLKELVPALLKWSHDHKNHFKVKVRHIFERMLRRFNWEEVYSCAGEEEAAKVLVNIKKRKDRAKRKKASRAEAGDDDDEHQGPSKPVAGDAFEDVLYGSESELEDSEDEGAEAAPTASKKKQQNLGVRLRLDNDEPMDLLEGAATRVTSMAISYTSCSLMPNSLLDAKSNRRKQPGQDASRFKVDEDSGKMVIDEGPDSDEDPAENPSDVAGTAYREAITSVDGFTRGPNGKIKFNKNTKKRRREEEAIEDVEMADAQDTPTGGKPKKPRSKSEPKLGQEFRAKVSVCVASLSPSGLDLSLRKQVATSKRMGWILMRTYHSLKQPRVGARKLGSQESGRFGSLHSLLHSFFLLSSISWNVLSVKGLIVRCSEQSCLPASWLSPLKNVLVQNFGNDRCKEPCIRTIVSFKDEL